VSFLLNLLHVPQGAAALPRVLGQSTAVLLRAEWDRFYVVTIEELCLIQAIEIGFAQRVRTLDAIHLAAATRSARTFVARG
jgi:hypothetical protein